jgi:hypothetical protein
MNNNLKLLCNNHLLGSELSSPESTVIEVLKARARKTSPSKVFFCITDELVRAIPRNFYAH